MQHTESLRNNLAQINKRFSVEKDMMLKASLNTKRKEVQEELKKLGTWTVQFVNAGKLQCSWHC